MSVHDIIVSVCDLVVSVHDIIVSVHDLVVSVCDLSVSVLAIAGHTASWGKGYPELLTQCCDEQGMPNGQLGPLNPTRNSTYNALWLLLREAAQLFPDTYLHLGGDEVPFDCWQVCPGTPLFVDLIWCALNISCLQVVGHVKVCVCLLHA